MDKVFLFDTVDSLSSDLISLSRRIWEYAETAFDEHKSAEALASFLEAEGFNVTRNAANISTAFTAAYGEGSPCCALLGEYDALSGLGHRAGEAKYSPPDSSAPGHGCGHNLLGVGSLGAAVALKRAIEKGLLRGKIIYFGCPAEEGGSGKTFMAREKLFAKADFALDWHPGNANSVALDSSLANYQIMYRFRGISSHAGGAPEKGRSALDGVELMNIGVQFLREHIPTTHRIHYAITDTGGFSPNVVQSNAEVLYLMRAPTIEEVEALYERVNRIAHGAALMTDTTVEVDFVKACSQVIPNRALADILYKNLELVGPPVFEDADHAFADSLAESYGGSVVPESAPEGFSGSLATYLNPYTPEIEGASGGSTDVGDVSGMIPTARIYIASAPIGIPSHSWQMTSCSGSSVGFKGMICAAKVLASAAADILESDEIITKAKEELSCRRNGSEYICPIPEGIVPRVLKFR